MTDPIPYHELTEEQRATCDHAIDTFCRYLNHLGEFNKLAEEAPIRVSREMMFEEGPDFEPHLMLEAQYPWRFGWNHVFVFALDPFHDEGGPNQVMAVYRDYGSGPLLETYLWEFDTDWVVIPSNFFEDRFMRDVTAEVNEGRK